METILRYRLDKVNTKAYIARMENERAIIRQVSRCDPKGYYLMTRPDGTEISGDSKAALVRYARAQGWTIEYIPLPNERKFHTAINDPTDW